MNRIVTLLVLLSLLGCGTSLPDYSTPENTVRSLEKAYADRDIEAAVRCMDFETEA